jgi:hypothetical protein
MHLRCLLFHLRLLQIVSAYIEDLRTVCMEGISPVHIRGLYYAKLLNYENATLHLQCCLFKDDSQNKVMCCRNR